MNKLPVLLAVSLWSLVVGLLVVSTPVFALTNKPNDTTVDPEKIQYLDTTPYNTKRGDKVEVSFRVLKGQKQVDLDFSVGLDSPTINISDVDDQTAEYARRALLPANLQENAADRSFMQPQKGQVFHPVCQTVRGLVIRAKGNIKYEAGQGYDKYLHDTRILWLVIAPGMSGGTLVGAAAPLVIDDPVGNARLPRCLEPSGVSEKDEQESADGKTTYSGGSLADLICKVQLPDIFKRGLCDTFTYEVKIMVQVNNYLSGTKPMRESVVGDTTKKNGMANFALPYQQTNKKCFANSLQPNSYSVAGEDRNVNVGFKDLGETVDRWNAMRCMLTPKGLRPDICPTPDPDPDAGCSCIDAKDKTNLEFNFGRLKPQIIEKGDTPTVLFSWDEVPGATRYKVDYQPVDNGDNDAGWQPKPSDDAVSGTWTSETSMKKTLFYPGSMCNRDIWWRVLAMDDCSAGTQIRAKKGEDAPGFVDRGKINIPCT